MGLVLLIFLGFFVVLCFDFLLCFICLRSVSCVSSVVSVTGLSMLDYPFGFLQRLFMKAKKGRSYEGDVMLIAETSFCLYDT